MRKQKSFSISGFLALAISCCLLIVTSCQRDIDDPGNSNNTGGGNTGTINDNITVVAGIRGVVVDENNQPVQGATVKSGTNTTTTDRYGVFRFNNINISKENGHVQIERTGYFTAHRTFPSTAGRIHNVRIKLLPKTNTGNFAASAGGTVTLTSGGKLVIPANAVTDASGNAYSGQVNVAMTWINPTATDLPEIMMGDLRGVTTGGQERGLETFGMLGVEMTNPGGQTLKIANGKTAELSFPIPATMAGAAPATIDLWHFDEPTGRWKQEGTATKSGNLYIAQVSHFSFWNCDAPFPLINLCMTIVNASNNQPLNNVQVRIKRANGSYGSGWTDSTGNLCGKVPKDELLTLEIVDNQCYSVVYSQNIGPFSSNATLPPISVTIPSPNSLTISGVLQNCANANVTNGAVAIYIGGGPNHSYSIPVTNGTFSLTLIRCGGAVLNFSLLGVDYTTMQQSAITGGSGTTGTVNVGTIQACGTSAVQFLELMVDGTPTTFIIPPDLAYCNDSSNTGTYTNRTFTNWFRQNSGTTLTSAFSFENNMAPGNALPLSSLFVSTVNNMASQQILTPSPVINITTFGVPGTGFIEGNFAVQMSFLNGPKNVTGNFRIRRN